MAFATVLSFVPVEVRAAPEDITSIIRIGTWVIAAEPPAGAESVCDEHLPSGTRLRVHVDGPSRLAIEEDRHNELRGRLWLLGPHKPAICRTGLGSTTGFGVNVCTLELHPRPDLPRDVEFDGLGVTFSRWSTKDAKASDNEFFAALGAKAGARFALLNLKDKGLGWTLWLKSANEMVSECMVKLPGKNNIDSFPMVWRRER